MPASAIYQTFGNQFPDMHLRFVDSNTYFTWQFAVSAVKDWSKRVPKGSTNRADYQPFMDGVRDLRARWGGLLVPEDVKSALQSIEEAFNLPFTEWTEAERYQAGTIVDATHLGPFPAPAELAALAFNGDNGGAPV